MIANLVDAMKDATKQIQEKMVWHFTQCDADYGRRLAEGLGLSAPADGSMQNGSNGQAHGSTLGVEPAVASKTVR